MTVLASELDRTLEELDPDAASRLERLVRNAMDSVRTAEPVSEGAERGEWLKRLERLRDSVGTGKQVPSTEDILDDLRSED